MFPSMRSNQSTAPEFEVDKKDVQLHWKGSSNQRVIDVPKTLERGEVVLHEENC